MELRKYAVEDVIKYRHHTWHSMHREQIFIDFKNDSHKAIRAYKKNHLA